MIVNIYSKNTLKIIGRPVISAPNFMVKAIAEQRKVAMPSFFGYLAWSFGILVPLFVLHTLIFFVFQLF